MNPSLIKEALSSQSYFSNKKITDIQPVHGGCIHKAWQIKLGNGKKLFAKTSARKNLEMLKFESNGLNVLNNKINQEFLEIPKPLIVDQLETCSMLIMPWLDLRAGNEIKLGKGLAILHKESSEESQRFFGWDKDGFIGDNPQIRGWEESWGKCFVKLRLEPQIKLARKWGINFEFKNFFSLLILYLDKHNPKPSLVHGDLWKGNASVNLEGKGIIFDPAIWWADREVDIAMTHLFGGFSKDFYSAYNSIWPLPESYQDRIDIYNLYHVLNHANLFGGSYKQQTEDLINKINIVLKSY